MPLLQVASQKGTFASCHGKNSWWATHNNSFYLVFCNLIHYEFLIITKKAKVRYMRNFEYLLNLIHVERVVLKLRLLFTQEFISRSLLTILVMSIFRILRFLLFFIDFLLFQKKIIINVSFLPELGRFCLTFASGAHVATIGEIVIFA